MHCCSVCIVQQGYKQSLLDGHILLFQQEVIEANEKIMKLEELIKGTRQFTAEATLASDSFVQSGLPNAEVLNALYEFVALKETSVLSKLTLFQELMLTLSKLRLNASMQDLAYRFSSIVPLFLASS